MYVTQMGFEQYIYINRRFEMISKRKKIKKDSYILTTKLPEYIKWNNRVRLIASKKIYEKIDRDLLVYRLYRIN